MARKAVKARLILLFVAGATAVILLLTNTVAISSSSPSSSNNVEPLRLHLTEAPKTLPQTTTSTNLRKDECEDDIKNKDLPPLYIITPTYPRAEQIPEITRTGQTLLNVKNVVWIVSEDTPIPTQALVDYLEQLPLNTVYLRVEMPSKYQKAKNKPRGVANRMAGMNWVRKNANNGVFYFADDDNTYDIRIFEEMRWTKKVSMFPVGLVTKLGVSTPIVKKGKVVGFYDGWIANRKFPVDMAGFAVSVPFLLSKPNATMPFSVGYEEDGFIKSLGITPAEIEPLAFNCTKIWVWHTQTKKNKAADPVAQNNKTKGSNLDIIKNLLWKGSAKKR